STVAKYPARRAVRRKAASPEHRGCALFHRARRSWAAHFGPHPSRVDGVHACLGQLAREQASERVQGGLARFVSTRRLLAESEDVIERQIWILQLAHQRLGLAGERAQ